MEVGSLRSGCQHHWGRALIWVIDFLYPHMVEGARELSSLFHKAVILFTGFHPYGLRTSQTSHLPIPLYQMILWNHCMTSKLPILGLLFCEGRNLGVFKQLLLWLFVKCSQIQSILIQMLTWGALKNIPRPRLPPRSFRSATLGDGIQASVIFLSFPSDSTVQPRLRITVSGRQASNLACSRISWW